MANKTTVTDQLYMIFGLDNDKTYTLKLSDPKTGLTLTEVNQASEAMLTKEAIKVGGSAIIELKDAYEYKVTKEQINLA